ncbi:MAG: porin [Bacteroidota bacterium]
MSLCVFFSSAQDITNNSFGKGIKLTARDSSYNMKFSARFQTLYDGERNLETGAWSDAMMVRRTRLKFSGFAYSPKIRYKLELALSNRDNGKIAPETNLAANIVLDAVVKYEFIKNWELWFGQTKLPGNRERVISSQNLQFVDRSLVNSRFTIDRGVGVQLRHKHRFGDMVIKEIGSASFGEGRNMTIDNIGGYEFTGRMEILPFGEFTSKGDYFGSDLMREETPKLAIGITYDQNNNTPRTRGFKGEYLSQLKDQRTVFIDGMFKYRGFSTMFEYADKQVDGSPIVSDGIFYTGSGINIQSGYLLKNNIEFAGRYTAINPDNSEELTEYTFGVSKYVSGHSLKVQSDLTYIEAQQSGDKLRFRIQVEVSL